MSDEHEIIRHWQRFAKQLGDILGCSSVDTDILETAKRLRAAVKERGDTKAIELLKVAVCPACDGSGAIAVQRSERRYVTAEMAKDAGDPEMEGALYSDEEWEQQQCQWCDERKQLLAAAIQQGADQ